MVLTLYPGQRLAPRIEPNPRTGLQKSTDLLVLRRLPFQRIVSGDPPHHGVERWVSMLWRASNVAASLAPAAPRLLGPAACQFPPNLFLGAPVGSRKQCSQNYRVF